MDTHTGVMSVVKGSKCLKCGTEFPSTLLSRVRHWCTECEKADKISFCKNDFCAAPLPFGHPDGVCDACKTARNAKFVSRDLFDAALKSQEDRFKKLQEASLARFSALFNAQDADVTAPTHSLQPPPASYRRPPASAVGRPPREDEVQSTISIRPGSEALFRRDQRTGGEDQDDGIADSDSVSQTGRGSVSTLALKEDKQDFLRIIRTLAGEEDQEEPPKLDAMARMFGESKAFDKKRSSSLPLPTSDLQKDLLTRHLFPKKLGSVKVGERASIAMRVKEEDYSYFRTPLPNPGLIEFISARRQADPSCRGGEEKKVIKDPLVKATEKVLYQVDQASRIGAKLAVYDQWLLTALKESFVKDMGSAIPPDSLTGKLLDELMVNSVTLMAQSCRTASLSLAERRRIYLQELKLNKWPNDKALELPPDASGQYLFGTGADEKGEVVTIDSIIETYADKFKSVKASAAAFKVPLAPNNRGNAGNNAGGNANRGGARSGQQGQKRQSENSGWNRNKQQKGANKKGSNYKPFEANPSSGGDSRFHKK